MKLYFVISLLPCLFYLIFKSKKAMHMLQQNWYNDGNRYIIWVFQNAKKAFLTFDLLFIVFYFLKGLPAIIVFEVYFIMCYVIHKYRVGKEQSKKPLVITARIKRLYVTLLILYIVFGILTIGYGFNEDYIGYYYLYLGALVYLNWFIVVLANIINKPIEKLVFLHYKRLAKNKLNEMTNLK